ncbi:hypothetical protein DTO164E3_1813 [Paecilomyces variotii]|nr:hypothetical protein DTO164E3_1813 [Paecilomyces variotii]
MDHSLFAPVARSFGQMDESDVFNKSSKALQKTQNFIFKLILQESISERTSTMLLVAFDAAAAALVIGIIVYDAWRVYELSPLLKSEKKYRFLRMLHPADLVPLVLASAIIVQSLIFLGVQGTGLKSIFVGNCQHIAQAVFPAVWIVAFTILTFGAETAYRGLQRDRFAPRGKWNIPICCAVASFLVILTLIPTATKPVKFHECFDTLIFFSAFWADVAFAIGLTLIILYIGIGAVVTVQLLRTVKLDRDERVAASRVVYYLAAGALLLVFILPFWALFTFAHRVGVTAMMAVVTLNLSGFVFFFMHLVLRSNADNLAIRPVNAPWRRNQGWKLFGSMPLDIGQHITTPLERKNSLASRFGYGNEKSYYGDHDVSVVSGASGHMESATRPSTATRPGTATRPASANNVDTQKSLPPPPPPQYQDTIVSGHSRKVSNNYSIFPAAESTPSVLPAQTTSSMYSMGNGSFLVPPQPPFARSHQLYSSGVSSATVQIGLRLSNVGSTPQTMSLSSPYQSPAQQSFSTQQNDRGFSRQSYDVPFTMDTMKEIEDYLSGPESQRRSESPGPYYSDSDVGNHNSSSSGNTIDRAAIMKVLPPPPPLSLAPRQSVPPGSGLYRLSEARSQEISPREDAWPSEPSLATLPQKSYQPQNDWL